MSILVSHSLAGYKCLLFAHHHQAADFCRLFLIAKTPEDDSTGLVSDHFYLFSGIQDELKKSCAIDSGETEVHPFHILNGNCKGNLWEIPVVRHCDPALKIKGNYGYRAHLGDVTHIHNSDKCQI